MSRTDSPDISDAPSSRRALWCSGLAIALVFVCAAALTWRKWPDILIDFGMQLYLPWKISTGSVLYRDVRYLTAGPLSQYYHALLFKYFGVSFRTLIIANLTLTACLLFLLHRCFRAATDLWTATVICLALVLAFVFNQYGDIGNYNFIAPYCHEVVHGVILSILTIVFLAKWLTRLKSGFAAAAGFCAGLVFLTKPEVFTALSMAVVAAFGLFVMNHGRAGLVFALKSLGVFIMLGAAPFFSFAVYFHQFEDTAAAYRSAGFAWVPILHGGVSSGVYYRWCLGLDTPGFHVMAMLKQLCVVAAVMAWFVFLFRRKLERSHNRLLAIGGVALVLAGASGYDWTDCGRTLGLLDLIFCALLIANRRKLADEKAFGFLFMWSVFAFFLTAKLGLFCRIWHYGFILAMPAFVTAICLLLWLLPRLLQKFGVHTGYFRGAASLVLLFGCAHLFVQSQIIYRDKTVAVGTGGDTIFASASKLNPVGAAFQSALPWLEQNAPPNATLAVLPEGVMLNYLSRRTNPTANLVWNPVELSMFGQDNMAAAFRRNAPDYVVLVHRDGAEYGAGFFGQQPEFGLELMQWIKENYEPVLLIGHEPLQKSLFGLKILKHRSGNP